MANRSRIPNGLTFFTAETTPAKRRRRLIFVVVLTVAELALIWPIYALFSGIFPLILGLPLSLTWVILWLFVVLGALVWLYRAEET